MLIDKLSADWHNTAYTYPELNYGSTSSLPFNDLIVVNAELNQETEGEQCPLGYKPLFDQNWFGLSAGCNCTGIFEKTVRKQDGLFPKACTIVERADGCSDI